MKEMHLVSARIEKNDCISPDIFHMEIYAPEIAKTARAGQFVMVYLDKSELLLPRPISLCDANHETGTIELVYQVVGKGTKVMSEILPKQQIKLLGALGNGFFTEGKNGKKFNRAALVGGGIGAPPLYFLAKNLVKNETRVDIFLGFRTAPILVEKFRAITQGEIFIATEDGSVGHHGRVTEILAERNEKYDEILACGPAPMLRALADYALNSKIPCQICMEERMACGLGTCVGCVVKVGESYVRVCSEGPVFYADEVNLNG